MRRGRRTVVLDTNVFVAAGFRTKSDSARILRAVRATDLRMVWDEETRRETRRVLERIPPLSWADVADLFRNEDRWPTTTDPGRFGQVPDATDRKFAALAHASGAVLISQDDDLLAHPERIDVLVLTPSEFLSDRWATLRA